MDGQLINVTDGTVTLPVTDMLNPALMHREFKSSEFFDLVRALHGAPGYRTYHFGAGAIADKPWFATVSFFNELLVNVDIGAMLYPRDSWNEIELDYDVESETKQFHEQLLVTSLGAPEVSKVPKSGHSRKLADHQLTLAVPVTWKFNWGSVVSSHDFNDHTTLIRITYASRTEKKFARFKTKPSR